MTTLADTIALEEILALIASQYVTVRDVLTFIKYYDETAGRLVLSSAGEQYAEYYAAKSAKWQSALQSFTEQEIAYEKLRMHEAYCRMSFEVAVNQNPCNPWDLEHMRESWDLAKDKLDAAQPLV